MMYVDGQGRLVIPPHSAPIKVRYSDEYIDTYRLGTRCTPSGSGKIKALEGSTTSSSSSLRLGLDGSTCSNLVCSFLRCYVSCVGSVVSS